MLPPITGGGFGAALLQLCSVYYVGCCAVHAVIPSLARPVSKVNQHEPKPGQVSTDEGCGGFLPVEAAALHAACKPRRADLLLTLFFL
mmetsp:Transcript_3610/g.9038  ORF Transcript_3610/g.9038 Transcript_3610/m.9038 type:complete len:88 (-) Transcript_3610:1106-1369(-)